MCTLASVSVRREAGSGAGLHDGGSGHELLPGELPNMLWEEGRKEGGREEERRGGREKGKMEKGIKERDKGCVETSTCYI